MEIYSRHAGTIEQTTFSRFETDVVEGLTASPKYLQSKYFYDKEGDRLFQQIMECDEYYLTKCEMEIFSNQTAGIARIFLQGDKEFDIVELGAGDATKSTYLLKHVADTAVNITYYPIDISKNVIRLLHDEMPQRIRGLNVHGLHGEYVEMIEEVSPISKRRKAILFLGSNIGNFTKDAAIEFLNDVYAYMNTGDLILIGFDLKKNPKQILAAYNDSAGITREFNLNLLKRINKELGANINIGQFDHYPTYDPITGACRSYLISLANQKVTIGNYVIEFEKHETVYMELSQKYSLQEIEDLARQTGFKPVDHFFDSHQWFVDTIWEKEV